MESRNPVLSRIGQPGPGGTGFAYDEGLSAYNAAGQQQGQYPAPQQYPPQQYPTAGAPSAPQYGQPGVPPQYPTQYPPAPSGPPTGSRFEPITSRMTLDDVLVKTGITLAVVIAFAVIGWNTAATMPVLYIVGAIGGMILGFVNVFKRVVSPALVLLYAAFEGLFLGGISYAYNQFAIGVDYPGLVQQAVLGTLVAFVVMLALYKSRLVKVNGTFAKMMMVAMVSYLVIAFASFIAALFGVGGGWGFYGVGTLGIVLCMIGVALASFSLMLDFESINQGIRMGLPERESWRMAFGLMVTLIWLYLEILRLLAIIAANRD